MATSSMWASSDSAPHHVPPLHADRSDAELLSDGVDPAGAYAIFYRRHVDALIRFAASRGLNADAAADVVAETFLGAYKARHSFRPERENARLWLLAIASRRVADQYRRQGSEDRRNERLRTEAIVLSQVDRDSYHRLLEEGSERALDALADLPPVQQEALRARVVDEREYAEIANALGLSQPAARQHVSRGLSVLRRKLKGTP